MREIDVKTRVGKMGSGGGLKLSIASRKKKNKNTSTASGQEHCSVSFLCAIAGAH
jgi:hypothetical protein